MTEQEW